MRELNKSIIEYIDTNFKKCDSLHVITKRIETFGNYLDSQDIEINPELLKGILEDNTMLNNYLDQIYNANKERIQSGEYSYYATDDFLESLIDIYCEINNIIIDSNIYNNYYDDFVKHNKVDDSLKLYLLDISRYPLLSKEEERELAIKIANGDLEAKKKFIECNLRLVVPIAKRFANKGVSIQDMIQEANIVLMNTVEKYDVSKGFRFSTYATIRIRYQLRKVILNTSRTIRIPIHAEEKIRKIKSVANLMYDKLGYEPDLKELALNVGMPEEEVENLLSANIELVSLNSPISNEDDTELQSFVPSDEKNPEEIAIKSSLRNEIKKLFFMCELTARETAVLSLRFGINGGKYLTLENVGAMWGCSRERIRQIEAKAMKKIRCSPYTKELAIFMDNPEKCVRSLREYKEHGIYPSKKQNYRKYIEPEKKTIYDYFRYVNKESIDEAISKLEPREIELIRKKHDLDKDLGQYEEYELFAKIMPKLRKYIIELDGKIKNGSDSLLNYFRNFSEDEIKEGIIKLSDMERSILFARYNVDLKKNDTQLEVTTINKLYSRILPRLKRMLYKTAEIEGDDIGVNSRITNAVKKPQDVTERDKEKIIKILNRPIFIALLDHYSSQVVEMVLLKYGFIDGKFYPDDVIYSHYNITPNSLDYIIDNCYSEYKKLVKEYFEILLNDEKNMSRALKKAN